MSSSALRLTPPIVVLVLESAIFASTKLFTSFSAYEIPAATATVAVLPDDIPKVTATAVVAASISDVDSASSETDPPALTSTPLMTAWV